MMSASNRHFLNTPTIVLVATDTATWLFAGTAFLALMGLFASIAVLGIVSGGSVTDAVGYLLHMTVCSAFASLVMAFVMNALDTNDHKRRLRQVYRSDLARNRR